MLGFHRQAAPPVLAFAGPVRVEQRGLRQLESVQDGGAVASCVTLQERTAVALGDRQGGVGVGGGGAQPFKPTAVTARVQSVDQFTHGRGKVELVHAARRLSIYSNASWAIAR